MSSDETDPPAEAVEIITTIDPPPAKREPRVFRPIPARGRFAVPVSANTVGDDILVKAPGSLVKRGEILVEQWPQSAAAPLAPADGRIAGIGVAKLSAAKTVPAILFEIDPAAPIPAPTAVSTIDAIAPMLRRLRDIDLREGIETLRQHGVWADRWTTPDLLGQLHLCLQKPVDTVLCNALDESPDLLFHNELAIAYPVEMVAGVLALAQLLDVDQVWAVVAAFGNPAAWESLRAAVEGTKLKLVPLQDHYPQAHPTLLIHEVTNRHSRPTTLPAEAGVLTIDAAAAIAVGRCFLAGESMLSVPVGFRHITSDRKYWLDVPIGMPWSNALAHCWEDESRIELRAGNPIREFHLTSDCVAGGAELCVTAAAPRRRINPDPCIRCAWCVEGCPVRIQPAGLLEAAQQYDLHLGDQYGLDACIECGICSYVCPSHLPILAGIRALRGLDATSGLRGPT
jgi:Na+-translocating ferredoxin:NAD+ oxidoreductase RnfC subunit